MSSLINVQSITKSFGARPLFENVSFTISEGERIGLIGPNGSGKSTLMQIIAGVQTPDSGTVAYRKMLRAGYVPQESAFPEGATVRSVLEETVDRNLDEHERESMVHVIAGRAGFTRLDDSAEPLSGGWKKRLAIARELAGNPQVLLLDEPTNHLDLEGILWLEKLLAGAAFACVVVSHDRYFLENVATDMAEINRIYPEGLFRVRGSYSEFLLKREEHLYAQSKQQESLENKVRREVEWLRRGPKARTSKSRARIQGAERMIEDLADMQTRAQVNAAQIDFSSSGRKTKKLIAADDIRKELGGKLLFESLNLTLRPGVRMGLAGPNGSGKTTLLRILAGESEPDCGSIERAEGLRIVYFDQHREQLDLDVPLRRALSEHGDTVIYRDRPIHVAGWAKRFLFRAEQLDVSVGRLSGGERARVLIARLMLQPADVLLLDEPTNDLDIPTLETLEESLMEFEGALVLVTHDRYMLDRVSTTVLGLDGRGGSGVFADYSQWEQSRTEPEKQPVKPAAARTGAAPDVQPKKRLSYMENREYEQIEESIQAAEQELASRQAELQDAEVMRDPRRMQAVYENLQAAQAQVDRLYSRWAELEAKLS
jgi:ATP-binding cassette subfamily F protein uup